MIDTDNRAYRVVIDDVHTNIILDINDMISSIMNDHYCYDSNFFLSTAARQQYVLENESSYASDLSDYDPIVNDFRVQPSSYVRQQFFGRRGSIYDRPYTNDLNHEQLTTKELTPYKIHASIPCHRQEYGKQVSCLVDGTFPMNYSS
jgi:hypothetical protein